MTNCSTDDAGKKSDELTAKWDAFAAKVAREKAEREQQRKADAERYEAEKARAVAEAAAAERQRREQEERDRQNPPVRITLGPRNGTPKRTAIFWNEGKEVFRDVLDPDAAWQREPFIKEGLKRSGYNQMTWWERPGFPNHTSLDAQLVALAAAKDQPAGDPTRAPVVLTMQNIEAQPVEWLWSHWIPRGAITVLDGDPGRGKSTIVLDLGARRSRGWAMPPGGGPSGEAPADVLIMSAEDDLGRTIRPRLQAAGADLGRIHALTTIGSGEDGRPPMLPHDISAMERIVTDHGVALVVIDPLMAYLADGVDSHKDQCIRRVMHHLAAMAQRTGAAVLLVRHLHKQVGGPALYRGGGSIGIVGAARSALLVGQDPDDEHRRILARTKGNLGPCPRSLAYRLEPSGDVATVAWLGESDLLADDILPAPSNHRRRAEATDEAAEWLKGVLAKGPMDAETVLEQAKAEGLADKTLRRAKKRLGVKSGREGFGAEGRFMWRLVTDEDQE